MPSLPGSARAALVDQAIAAVNVVEAPLGEGYRPRAPYDVVVFAGAVAEMPGEILAQLAEDGRLGGGGQGRWRRRPRHPDDTDWRNHRAPRYIRRGNPVVAGFRAEACFCVLSCRICFTAAELLMSEAERIPEQGPADQCRAIEAERMAPARALAGISRRWPRSPGWSLAAAASPARAQTLTQALAEAYNTNPQLLAQRALLRATDEQVPQALSGWRPTVNFTGQLGGARGSFARAVGAPTPFISTFHQNSLNLQVTQPVYSGGRTVAQTRQAVNSVQATRAQTLAVETSVFQAVAQAYLDVVRDQALVEVNRNNVEVLRKQLEATQDRFRVGEVTRTDVAQAESSLAQAQGTLTAAEGTLAQSRAEYVRAVGHQPGRLLLPRERPALPATREEAQTLAANNNFSVISANFARARRARQHRRGA